MNSKKIAAISGVVLLAAVFLFFALRTAVLVPQVVDEINTTPTPTPLIGNVMVITPDPNATATPTVLKNGSSGDEVIRLQERLVELGYYTGTVDGQFGKGTRDAVMNFQQQNGLKADGIAGSATLNTLYDEQALVCSTPEPTPTPSPTPKPVITQQPTPVPTPKPTARSKGYIRPDGLPLIVSRSVPLPEGYETYDLVCMNDVCDPSIVKIKYSDTYAEREAVDALMIMLKAAHGDGLTVWQISAAYRTKEYQKQLFDKQVSTYMKNNNLTYKKP